MILIQQLWTDYKKPAPDKSIYQHLFCLFLLPSFVFAGIFNATRFIKPNQFTVGVEPELAFSHFIQSGTSVGMNLHGSYGLTSMNNLVIQVGAGTTPRNFRLEGLMTFDFFPDWKNQPGLGAIAGANLFGLRQTLACEVKTGPYIHKTFKVQSHYIEPFVAVPIGIVLWDNKFRIFSQIAIGSMFHYTEKWSTVLELGIGAANSYSYISGGIVYYY